MTDDICDDETRSRPAPPATHDGFDYRLVVTQSGFELVAFFQPHHARSVVDRYFCPICRAIDLQLVAERCGPRSKSTPPTTPTGQRGWVRRLANLTVCCGIHRSEVQTPKNSQEQRRDWCTVKISEDRWKKQ